MPDAPQCLFRRYGGMCACAPDGITRSREGTTVLYVDSTRSDTVVGRAFSQQFPNDLVHTSGRQEDKFRNIGRQLKAQAAKMLEVVQADATLSQKVSCQAWERLLPLAQQKHTSTGDCLECATIFPRTMESIALQAAKSQPAKKRKRRYTGVIPALPSAHTAVWCVYMYRNSVGTSTALRLLLQTTVFLKAMRRHDPRGMTACRECSTRDFAERTHA